MSYKVLSFLLAWLFPKASDRREFRKFCKGIDERKDRKIIYKNQERVVNILKNEIKKRKLKVVFLNTENAKWQYQSLYKRFAENPKFDVQVLVSVLRKFKGKNFTDECRENLIQNYNFFKNRGMNVDFLFDIESKKFKDLRNFSPDIVFYEQPWGLPDKYSLLKTSKYSLGFYCSYGSCTSNGENEYISSMYRDIFTYFVDNEYTKNFLIRKGYCKTHLAVAGQIKNDAYFLPIREDNIIWKTNKKRIIYAPHHSFDKNSTLSFGTFNLNYKFFYEYAKAHQEYEFIFKPHPKLKSEIVRTSLMTKDEADRYFQAWEELENAQVCDRGDYFDMFRTSDLMITDSNSFLYEYLPSKKPLIQLVSLFSVGLNPFGQQIVSGYYKAENNEETEKLIYQLLEKNNDYKKDIRIDLMTKKFPFIGQNVSEKIVNYIQSILED